MATNRAPKITSNGGKSTATLSLNENTTLVTTVSGVDPDKGTLLKYSIVDGLDSALFKISAFNGQLSFYVPPNFEAPTDGGANNVYDVIVQVSDGALTARQTISITVQNVNESPSITSNGGGATAAVTVDENTTRVTKVVGSDPDAGAALVYSILNVADAARFSINSATGELSFIAAPDFEAPSDAGANNVYDVTVSVSDGSLAKTQSISVTVKDLNDNAPVIGSNGGGASAAVTAQENQNVVTTVSATDADAGAVPVFSIAGGPDAALFVMDGATGALSFAAPPNFEAPADAGADNVYEVIVRASDGSLADTQAIAVTVTNANELPQIAVASAGAVTEQGTPNGTLAYTGSLAFTDPDTADVHLVTSGGGTNIGAVSAVKTGDTTGSGTGGVITWTYSVAAAAVEYLADGELLQEMFDITVDDQQGGQVVRQVAVLISGTNDGPMIVAEDLTGSVVEPETPYAILSDSGVITFTDADYADIHAVTTQPLAGAIGTLTAAKDSDTTGTGGGGKLTWTYTITEAEMAAIPGGGPHTQSFEIRLDDGEGGEVVRQVDIAVTATVNAPPEFLDGAYEGGLSESDSGARTVTGTFSFTDADGVQPHLLTVDPSYIDTLGTLDVRILQDTGVGINGIGEWTYTVSAEAMEALGEGSGAAEYFNIRIDDQDDGQVSHQVRVFLNGANDDPRIGNLQWTGVAYESLSYELFGSFEFTDVDRNDSHSFEFTQVSGPQIGIPAVQWGGAGNPVGLKLSLDLAYLNQLAQDQTVTQQFLVSVRDNHAGMDSELIDVTLHGENDAPYFGGGIDTISLDVQNAQDGVLRGGDMLAYFDVDLTDFHTVSAVRVPTPLSTAGDGFGTVTATATHEPQLTFGPMRLDWEFTADADDYEALAFGQVAIETFVLTLEDSYHAQSQVNVEVRINGKNEAPTITAGEFSGSVIAPDTLTVSGLVDFADKDLIDTHFVSQEGNPIGNALGTLTTVLEQDATNNGTGGRVRWTYSISAEQMGQVFGPGPHIQSFTFAIDDGKGGYITPQIDIDVHGLPHQLSLQEDSGDAAEAGGAGNEFGYGAIGNVLANDTSTAGDLRVIAVGGSANQVGASFLTRYGVLTMSANGDYAYSPDNANSEVEALRDADQALTETILYEATDASGQVKTSALNITIRGTNDAPTSVIASDNSFMANATGPLVASLSSTDKEDLSTQLSYSILPGEDGADFRVLGNLLLTKVAQPAFTAGQLKTVNVGVTDSNGTTTTTSIAIEIVANNSRSLTTGADTVSPDGGDSEIFADATTLSAVDSIDAGLGTDTLVTVGASNFITLKDMATFSGIEQFRMLNTSLSGRQYLYLTGLLPKYVLGGDNSDYVGLSLGIDIVELGKGHDAIQLQDYRGGPTFTAGDLLDGGEGIDRFEIFGTDYLDMTEIEIKNFEVLDIFMAKMVKVNQSVIAPLLQISGNYRTGLVTDDATINYQGINLFGHYGRLYSTNVEGTLFLVDSPRQGGMVFGGEGFDTIQTTRFAFSDAQREQLFMYTNSVERIIDSGGTYLRPERTSEIVLTQGNETVNGGDEDSLIQTSEATLNAGDKINGGGGLDVLMLGGPGQYYLDQVAELAGLDQVRILSGFGNGAIELHLRDALDLSVIGSDQPDYVWLASGKDDVSLFGGDDVVVAGRPDLWTLGVGDKLDGGLGTDTLYLTGSNIRLLDLRVIDLTSFETVNLSYLTIAQVDANSLRDVTRIGGTESTIITSDALLDLRGKVVFDGSVRSDNQDGTTFSVNSIDFLSRIYGGPGHDTLVVEGYALSQAQIDWTLANTSIEAIQDISGIYGL